MNNDPHSYSSITGISTLTATALDPDGKTVTDIKYLYAFPGQAHTLEFETSKGQSSRYYRT